MKRKYQYDLLRVISILFVVMIHTGCTELAGKGIIDYPIAAVLFLCNGMFFMMSGRLNLSCEFRKAEDYRHFYWKRFTHVILPYIIFTFLLCAWNLQAQGELAGAGAAGYLKAVYLDFMNRNSTVHLWFMYPMIGCIVSTPFLSKMVHHMSSAEMKIFLAIGLAWNFVRVYLTEDLGISFTYNDWIGGDWVLYYMAGYMLPERVSEERFFRRTLLAGLAGYVITIFGAVSHKFAPSWFSFGFTYDLSPAYSLFNFAVFAFFERKVVIRSERNQKFLQFCAGHTYTIFLIHWNINQYWISPNVQISGSQILTKFLCTILVVLVSFAFAVPFDLLYGQMQKKMMRWGHGQ